MNASIDFQGHSAQIWKATCKNQDSVQTIHSILITFVRSPMKRAFALLMFKVIGQGHW